jgi:phosphoribosylformylglycinamidine (FGAM) synthase-like amidotransferase family enzyme
MGVHGCWVRRGRRADVRYRRRHGRPHRVPRARCVRGVLVWRRTRRWRRVGARSIAARRTGGARAAFAAFFARDDTFALGVCNGCQFLSHMREGRAAFVQGALEAFDSQGLGAVRYVDGAGKPTGVYPLNPNGSPGGLMGVQSR